MVKSKKLSKILVTLILLLVTSFSIVFVAMQINKTTNDTNLSVSAVSDTSANNLSLIEPYDIMDGIGCELCNKGAGSMDKPYHEAPWNGRIKCYDRISSKRYGGRIYTIEINVDVRDIAIFNDDVIVEFKFYYQEPTLGTKKTMKVNSLDISAKFYSNGVETATPTRNCRDKSSAGFTIQGGQKTDMVTVQIDYSFDDDYYFMEKSLWFLFDNNTNYCTHK